jgi:hypothetical protein
VTEEWREVPGHPLLEASSLGRVRSKPYETPMPSGGKKINQVSPTYGVWAKDKRRYLLLFRRKTYKVARLVCAAFHGPAPEGRERVLHGDEDSRNNTPSNLSWGTQKENLNAPGFLAYCRSRTGENNPFVKGRR